MFKLFASFHRHMWIQTGVTVRKWLSWVLTSVTLTFDLWPWPFAWTSLLPMVITPENFMMIWWWKHSEKGVTDGRTDGRTDWTSHRAAWSQLKMKNCSKPFQFWTEGRPIFGHICERYWKPASQLIRYARHVPTTHINILSLPASILYDKAPKFGAVGIFLRVILLKRFLVTHFLCWSTEVSCRLGLLLFLLPCWWFQNLNTHVTLPKHNYEIIFQMAS